MQGIQPRGSLCSPAWREEEEGVLQPTNAARTGSGPCWRVYRGAWSHTSPRPSQVMFVSTCPWNSIGLASWVWGEPNPKYKKNPSQPQLSVFTALRCLAGVQHQSSVRPGGSPAASSSFLCLSQIKGATELPMELPLRVSGLEFRQRRGEEREDANSPWSCQLHPPSHPPVAPKLSQDQNHLHKVPVSGTTLGSGRAGTRGESLLACPFSVITSTLAAFLPKKWCMWFFFS